MRLYKCTIYANTASVGLAGLRSVRLWVDWPSEVRPSSQVPSRIVTIQWQTHKYIYWMELTEPTLAHLLAGIDRILPRGFGYCMLVGGTGQGTRLLRDDPEEPLPHAAMIPITNSRHVGIWWSLNPPSEPMDQRFCAHYSTNTEDSTAAPGHLRVDPRDNRGTPSDEEWPSSNEEPNSDCHQPASSGTAAKRTTLSRTTRSSNMTKKTGRTHRINWADVGESEPDSDVAADRGIEFGKRGDPSPRFQPYIVSW